MQMTQEQISLVEDNMALVTYIINTYFSGISFESREDLFQVGCLHLCMAANRYDETKSKFGTYASSYIINGILTYLDQFHTTVHTSRGVRNNWKKVIKVCADPSNPSEAEMEELHNEGLSDTDISVAICSCNPIYLDSTIKSSYKDTQDNDDDFYYLVSNTDQSIDEMILYEDVSRFSERLDSTELKVWNELVEHCRCGKDIIQTEFSKKLGISQSYISRVIKSISKKLKEYLEI